MFRLIMLFVSPVSLLCQVPDYHEIITYPMDLGTMMKKIDEHCYTLPKQWIADIELIARNALEYVASIRCPLKLDYVLALKCSHVQI